MATIRTLDELFVHELQDMASSEEQLTKALPKLAESAESEQLRSAFTDHLAETNEHLRKVRQILESLGAERGRSKCAAMAGIISEGEDVLKSTAKHPSHDAALIAAAQKAEHYEIATYGTLRVWARQLGLGQAAATIESILEEETAADESLTEISQSANPRAEMESGRSSKGQRSAR